METLTERIKIIESSDYDKFKYVGANRKLNEHHVLALMDSIAHKNLLSIQPCLISGAGEIIDGQHRIEAAKRLNTPFYYIIADQLDHQDILNLNNVQLGWGNFDFINFYTIKKHPSYIILSELLEKYYPELTLAKILLVVSSNGHNSVQFLRDGKVDVENHKNFDAIIKQYNDYRRISIHQKDKFFLIAIRTLFMKEGNRGFEYNHQLVMKKIKEKGISFDEWLHAKFGVGLIGEHKIMDTIKTIQLLNA